MKKIKHVILVFTVCILLTGCTVRNQEYYDKVTNIVISFYRSSEYDEETIIKKDREAIKTYLRTLTHIDEKIDMGAFIDKNSPSSEGASSLLTYENDTCYIDYNTLKQKFTEYYNENENPIMEAYYTATCNGYYATIYESDLEPDYSVTTSNPKYDYVLLKKYKDKEGYHYIFNSTYDGTGLKLDIIIEKSQITKINTEQVNSSDYIE